MHTASNAPRCLWSGCSRRARADLYGQFTEGFDTPILIEAKALLDELR